MNPASKFIFRCMISLTLVILIFAQEVSAITIKEEEELAREFMKVVKSNYKLITDPMIVGYVNDVGKKILAAMPDQSFNYRFYIIKEEVYNAFAGPGGHIFINSGLFLAMETEEELAGIIAHEIAHVLCRHISEKIERSKKIGIATLAGVVAGIFLGAGGASEVANAVTLGSIAAAQSANLAYSREDEIQADQIALKYLSTAGYGREGLLSVLKKIRSKQWFGSEQIPSYLSTHPASEDRMAYIGTWIEIHPKTLESIDPERFHLAHARLFALYGDKDAAIRYFESAATIKKDVLSHYGYALILSRLENYPAAILHMKMALEKRAFDADLMIDLGRLYFSSGQYEDAFKALQSVSELSSKNLEGLFYLGRTQLMLGKIDDAGKTFSSLIQKNADHAQAYYFLGEVFGKKGEMDQAHLNLGLYYRKIGDSKNALFHFERAARITKDTGRKQTLEELIKEVRKEA
ncbi:MAG: M48 family metalloprotease [Thermodesulfobacteriota bacterium]